MQNSDSNSPQVNGSGGNVANGGNGAGGPAGVQFAPHMGNMGGNMANNMGMMGMMPPNQYYMPPFFPQQMHQQFQQQGQPNYGKNQYSMGGMNNIAYQPFNPQAAGGYGNAAGYNGAGAGQPQAPSSQSESGGKFDARQQQIPQGSFDSTSMMGMNIGMNMGIPGMPGMGMGMGGMDGGYDFMGSAFVGGPGGNSPSTQGQKQKSGSSSIGQNDIGGYTQSKTDPREQPQRSGGFNNQRGVGMQQGYSQMPYQGHFSGN